MFLHSSQQTEPSPTRNCSTLKRTFFPILMIDVSSICVILCCCTIGRDANCMYKSYRKRFTINFIPWFFSVLVSRTSSAICAPSPSSRLPSPPWMVGTERPVICWYLWWMASSGRGNTLLLTSSKTQHTDVCCHPECQHVSTAGEKNQTHIVSVILFLFLLWIVVLFHDIKPERPDDNLDSVICDTPWKFLLLFMVHLFLRETLILWVLKRSNANCLFVLRDIQRGQICDGTPCSVSTVDQSAAHQQLWLKFAEVECVGRRCTTKTLPHSRWRQKISGVPVLSEECDTWATPGRHLGDLALRMALDCFW